MTLDPTCLPFSMNSCLLRVLFPFFVISKGLIDRIIFSFCRIYNEIYGRNLTLVGWYRSCPGLRALPSLKDTEAQLEYQV